MKKTIGRLFIDLLVVAIGVFIGMLASEWHENRKINETKNKSLHLIEAEVKSNLTKLENVYNYHITLRDSLRNFKISENLNSIQRPNFFKGLNIPTLQNSAYQSAIQTGVTREYDLSRLSFINNLYSNQTYYVNISDKATNALYNQNLGDIDNLLNLLQLLRISMTDICIAENNLMASYRDYLEKELE